MVRFQTKGFYPANQGGHLALHTWHTSEASLEAELAAWAERLKRGEISRVFVLNEAMHDVKELGYNFATGHIYEVLPARWPH